MEWGSSASESFPVRTSKHNAEEKDIRKSLSLMDDVEMHRVNTKPNSRVSTNSISDDVSTQDIEIDVANNFAISTDPANEGLPLQQHGKQDKTFKARHIQMMALGMIPLPLLN